MSSDDMFARWSARRSKVAREEAAKDPVPAPVEPEVPEPQTEEEEDALLASLGLPRPEDVTGAEVRKFLVKGVPEVFRRRALRALWRSDPTFAVLDGLNDYDEDFTLPEFNQKVIATAYQVGKGIVRKVEELVAEAEPETEAVDEDEVVDIEPLVAVRPPDASETTMAEVEEVASVPMDELEDDGAEPVFVPKRMSFDT